MTASTPRFQRQLDSLRRHKYLASALALMVSTAAWLGVSRTGVHARNAKVNQETREAMELIRDAAYRWHVLHGESTCPSFRQLVEGKFLDREARKVDAWEQPFVITCMESGAVVISLGPDRTRATADDIVVATPNSDFARVR